MEDSKMSNLSNFSSVHENSNHFQGYTDYGEKVYLSDSEKIYQQKQSFPYEDLFEPKKYDTSYLNNMCISLQVSNL